MSLMHTIATATITTTPRIAFIDPITSVSSCQPCGVLRQHLARQQGLEILPYCRNLNVSRLVSRALNDFYSIVGNFLSHVDSKGDTNQVRVLKLHSRTLVAVVQQNVDARDFKSASERFSGSADFFVARICGHDDNLKRRDRRRQPESVFIVRLLD